MSAAAKSDGRAEDVRSLLQASLGEAALGPREARTELAGGPCPVLRPADGGTLATALRVLAEHRLPALVRGGGTKTPPGAGVGARVVLDTGALGGVRELDVDEGVAQVGAGLPLAELAAALEGSGWEAPLDPPGEAGTVGGALAAAAVGPRFGHPRDVVLGLDVALATGERTRCGGRVVKNVTGYDLAKLH
ncbi:MAG: FAD-binding protein, partial [Myxococcota bacterium]|nr:FAD-binding protein [Myxococcota bacterium]